MKWIGKQRAWLLLRDKEFYAVYSTREMAGKARTAFSPGSKHKWTIRRVVVTEIH